MRFHRLLKLGVYLAASSSLCLTSLSYSEIAFNGFATFAAGSTTSDDQNLDNYDSDFSFSENSLLGLQANADIGEGLSATAQIISRGRENWETKFEWAYIGYEASDNVKLLFGRQRAPFYKYSDYLDVSFAYHWITPPEEVYSLPFDSMDGVGVVVNNQLGVFDSTLHFIAGRINETLESDGRANEVNAKNQVGAAWNLTWDWLGVRLGYSRSDVELNIPEIEALAAAWTEAGFPQFSPLISAADDNNTGEFFDVAITVDHENLLLLAEYTELGIEGTPFSEKREAYYVSAGYRFNKIMPHITFGSTEETASDYSFLDDVPTGVSAGLDSLTAATTALFEGAVSESEYYIIGLRWDFHTSAAFKMEYKSQDDKLTDETANLFRVALVTVF